MRRRFAAVLWVRERDFAAQTGPQSPALLSRTAMVWNSRRLWKSEQKWRFRVFYRNPISVLISAKFGRVMEKEKWWCWHHSFYKSQDDCSFRATVKLAPKLARNLFCSCKESEKVMLTCNLFRLLLQNNLLWDVVVTKLYSALILDLEFEHNTRVVVILTLLMEPKKNWESHVFFSIN